MAKTKAKAKLQRQQQHQPEEAVRRRGNCGGSVANKIPQTDMLNGNNVPQLNLSRAKAEHTTYHTLLCARRMRDDNTEQLNKFDKLIC